MLQRLWDGIAPHELPLSIVLVVLFIVVLIAWSALSKNSGGPPDPDNYR